MQHIYRYGMAIAQLMYAGSEGGRQRWILTSIGTLPAGRGKGLAQNVLQGVLNDADAEDVLLFLTIDPDPDMDPARLQRWYERNGFTLIPAEGPTMQRVPKRQDLQDADMRPLQL